MGGCASKSRVLKGDEPIGAPAPAPAPPPLPHKEEETVVKEAVVEEVKEEGLADDDTSNKNRSLGNLFKESEERKDSAEKETVKASDVPETTATEIEKKGQVKAEEDKAPEISTVASEKKKTTEEAKPAVVAEKSDINVVTPEEKKLEEINATITETPKEKNPEEAKASFVEAEERFETPKEEPAEKADEKLVISEEKKPAAEAQSDQKK